MEGREGKGRKGREGKESAPLDLNPGDATGSIIEICLY